MVPETVTELDARDAQIADLREESRSFRRALSNALERNAVAYGTCDRAVEVLNRALALLGEAKGPEGSLEWEERYDQVLEDAKEVMGA